MPVAKKVAPATKKAAPAKKAAHAADNAAAPEAAVKPTPKEKAPKGVPEPMEADVAEYRKPKRPSPTRVAKMPFGVVMLAWYPEKHGDDPANPADRDWEGFGNVEDVKTFFDAQVNWADEDVTDFGDFHHAIITLDATEPVHIGLCTVLAKNAEWIRSTKAYIMANPEVIFSSTKKEVVKEAIGGKAKKAAPVAVRKPSNAAQEVRAKAKAKAQPETDADGTPMHVVNKIAVLNEKVKEARQARAKRLEGAAADAKREVAKHEAEALAPRPRRKPVAVEAPAQKEIGTADIKAFVKAGRRSVS